MDDSSDIHEVLASFLYAEVDLVLLASTVEEMWNRWNTRLKTAFSRTILLDSNRHRARLLNGGRAVADTVHQHAGNVHRRCLRLAAVVGVDLE